ncbi:MAG: hypothetical protein PHF84_02330 [bacterium]|nr:hypothetical protein [bacterium]
MKKLLCSALIFLTAAVSLTAATAYKVGSWNEYKYYNEDNTFGAMKMSVVGQEGSAFWVETVTSGITGMKSKEKNIVKMLISADKEKSEVKRMIVQTGTEPAKEMPANMMKMMGGKGSGASLEEMKNLKEFYAKKGKDEVEITEKDNVTVKVPAGTFKTKYTRIIDKKANRTIELYFSESLLPAGIIKSLMNKKVQMELIKYGGKGAKSEITGKVEKTEMPNMPNMQEMMKQMNQPEEEGSEE